MPKGKKRKAYSNQEKAAAVEMYLSGPNSMREVANVLNLNVGSINTWVTLHRAAHPEDER